MSSIDWTSVSGLLVSISGLYYVWQVYTRQAPGNPVSWATWAVIGWAIWLTSDLSLGCNAQTFGAVNPTAIAMIAGWRQFTKAKMPTAREIVGGVMGLVAIAAWLMADKCGASTKWILGLSIIADCIPLGLIAKGAWEDPQADKPFAWLLFMFGYGVSVFGLETYSLFTLILPVYMVLGSGLVALPLVVYKVQTRAPLRLWA